MAKGVGLDAGEFAVKVVELDGSFRKPKLSKVSIDQVSQLTSSAGDPGHATAEAMALLHAVKDGRLGKQNVCLGFSSREATFRQLTVPFTGEERIRKVIKFEAERQIHSQSVDDMVIDFHVVEVVREETRVLIAGVPKAPLGITLDALAKVGIEPERVDLDTMALYRLADWSGALTVDDLVDVVPAADAAGDDAADGRDAGTAVAVPSTPEATSRLVLDIGARGVRVLAVADGHLVDMRAVPLGTDSIAEDLATRFGLSLDKARDAMIHCLSTGTDYVLGSDSGGDSDADSDGDDSDGDDSGGDDSGGDDSDGDDSDGDDSDGDDAEFVVEENGEAGENTTDLPARANSVPHAAVIESRDRLFMRVRREFMRFLVAVQGLGRIEAAFTTGAGSILPGMNELLADVFGCEPQPLLFLDRLSHDLSEEEVAYMEPRIAIAVGLALGELGGIKGFNFRQEELVYTRGFDRIKLPLAIACMLTLFYLFFTAVGLKKELGRKTLEYGGFAVSKKTGSGGRNSKKTEIKQYSGYLGALVNSKMWPAMNMGIAYPRMVNDLGKMQTFDRLNGYKNRLKKMLREVQKKGQYSPDLRLDSGVAVLQEFAGIIDDASAGMAAKDRFYVCDIELTLPPARFGKKGRFMRFKIFYRGENFRARNEHFESVLRAACEDRASPFESMDSSIETPGKNGKFYTFKVHLKHRIQVRKKLDHRTKVKKK